MRAAHSIGFFMLQLHKPPFLDFIASISPHVAFHFFHLN